MNVCVLLEKKQWVKVFWLLEEGNGIRLNEKGDDDDNDDADR